ncbi:CheB methylesterase domain-containing protein [Gymnodinialimonas sp. 2305UL16-5]
MSHFQSLGEAYSPTEETPPDIAICTQSITAAAEFPMYQALIELLGVRLVTVPDQIDAAGIARLLGMKAAEPRKPAPPETRTTGLDPQKIIAIGSSTGGIEALKQVLSRFPSNCPATVIVQHIRPEFLDGVVSRLDGICPAKVIAADHRMDLEPGLVQFAPGLPQHLEVDPKLRRTRLRAGPPVSGHQPSVDVLFQSLIPIASDVIGVLLTGMGRDGATGLGALRRAGAWTIAQDAETSTIYGMPRVADQEGAVCDVVPLNHIAAAAMRAAKRQRETLR